MQTQPDEIPLDAQARDLLSSHQQTIFKQTDRLFAVLMSLQYLGAVGAAFWFSPRAWTGENSSVHNNVWAAIFLGGLISIFPVYLALRNPGERSTRYVIAIGQMMMSSLLIHLTGGRIETHFHLFGSLAFLSFYRDWRVLVPATLVVVADHVVRGIYWPESIYGVLAGQNWRWAEHTFWVLFENTFLVIAIKRSISEMREIARRTSETSQLNEGLERAIRQRTAELEITNRNLENEIVAHRRLQVEAEIISNVIQSVTITDNLDDLLESIHQLLGKRLYADNCFIALYDQETKLLHSPFFVDKFDTAPAPAELGKGLTYYVLENETAMLLTADDIMKLTASGEISLIGTIPAVWLGVPLRAPHGIIGVLVVQHYEDAAVYEEHDVGFLSSIGDQVAIALQRRRTEDERLESEKQFRDMFDNAPVAYHELDTEGRYTRINRTEELLLGYTSEELKGRHPWEFIVENVSRSATADKLAGKVPLQAVERTFIRKDGSHVSVLNEDRLIYDESGKVTGIRTTLQDITALKALEQQLTHQALHDPLTKLGNRVLFQSRVEQAINRVKRRKTPAAVLFLDLDHFKSVNDSLGHAAGDELLVSATERLQGCLRATDTPARFGGDEFAVLLEDLEHADQAAIIAERIRLVLCTPFTIDGTEVFISTSIGIAITTDGSETPKDLLRNADVAMYLSKSSGKDRFTIFETHMHDVLIQRVHLESDMRSAIDNREFELYYQPIMDLSSERIMGMEALVRWNHPEKGLIAPLDFIPVAEQTGLIVPLGRWILEEACRQAREWQDAYQYPQPLSITVNISGRQFHEGDLLETVRQALASSRLPAQTLVLEITESTMLSNTDATIKKLNELKAVGIRFAIDDFGTGYSSLSYLQRFPVDILKIDKSFIDKIALDKEGAAVANAIITMSETLNLKTIAEGIESLGQKAVLQNLGCELGQGYHFAKPLRTADMDEFLRSMCFDQETVRPHELLQESMI